MTPRPKPPEGYDDNPPLDAAFFTRARPSHLKPLKGPKRMQTAELAGILRDRYHNARENQVVLSIHLFGIEFADELRGGHIDEVLALANVPKSYGTEVRKGIRLSEFVSLKK